MAFADAPTAEVVAEAAVPCYYATVEHEIPVEATNILKVVEDSSQLAYLVIVAWLVAEVVIGIAVSLGSILGTSVAWLAWVYRINRKTVKRKPQQQQVSYIQRLAWSYGF